MSNRVIALMLLAAACGSAPETSPAPIVSAMPSLQGDTLTRSGIRFIEVTSGTGPQVQRNRCVYAHYTGGLAASGTRFDTSRDTTPNGSPMPPLGFVLGIRQVIAGWDIGFDGMQVGGRRRLLIPWHLAYGDRGAPPVIPSRADLIFDVEVMEVGPGSSGRCTPRRG